MFTVSFLSERKSPFIARDFDISKVLSAHLGCGVTIKNVRCELSCEKRWFLFSPRLYGRSEVWRDQPASPQGHSLVDFSSALLSMSNPPPAVKTRPLFQDCVRTSVLINRTSFNLICTP